MHITHKALALKVKDKSLRVVTTGRDENLQLGIGAELVLLDCLLEVIVHVWLKVAVNYLFLQSNGTFYVACGQVELLVFCVVGGNVVETDSHVARIAELHVIVKGFLIVEE